jgi:hypothetical protein
MEINYFTPGQLSTQGPPLASYRPLTPVGALGPYLDAYTQPGDLVIDLFCQGPALVREAVQAGRRALGININRAILLAASLGLTAVERQAVEAAFTQLAEAQKGPQTLQAHIEGLYRTTCATCGAPTIADAFIWERDGSVPAEKRYHCTTCRETTGAPTDQNDRTAVAHFERRGLSYWLLLDRSAPGDAPHRERIAALLDLYTPRNLAAVNDLLLKSDGLTLAPPVRSVLDALLLDTLDRATSLRPPDSLVSRPRRLQRPARYVEANVWRLFEQALEIWRRTATTPVAHAPSLKDLLAQDALSLSPVSIHLASLSTGQAARDLPAGCAALILVDPPRPDTVLWHQSALWCYWLWSSQAGAPLTSFLSRRWLDKDWLWRGLRGALRAVAPLLRPDGRLVALFADDNPAVLEAVTLAAAGAGYELVGWGARPPGDVRLVWRFGGLRPTARATVPDRDRDTPAPGAVEADALSREVTEQAVNTSLNVLRTRSEPVAWPTLHAAIYANLAESGLLARAALLADDIAEPLSWLAETIRSALDGAPLHQISPPPTEETKGRPSAPLWWLGPSLELEATALLSDRVELTVAEILRDLLAVTEADLRRRVCERFPAAQTPDTRLVQLCLFSYGDEYAPGHWRLRSEDGLEARAAETASVIADLTSLGRRLGFEVAPGMAHAGEWEVRWTDEVGHTPYAFAVRTTAVLGDLLFNPPSLPTLTEAGGEETDGAERKTTPCLTLPGGRAVLVSYKLRQNPRLLQQTVQHGWQFLKFRHLRHLVQEVTAKQLDRYAFQAALGLDPIAEQEEAQLSLW